ncbi:MAG TPA: aspartate 1-decarboxylase [Desulfotomaculum sp.]|nr:aspartate 1-decarboxylase [Desulfotomaculum sp.]
MLLVMLRSKIHRAKVTEINLDYNGSITLDEALMSAADIIPGERVQVVNLNNGARFETYVISGPSGSGTVSLNGGAARLAQPGDKVIVMAFALVPHGEAHGFQPRIVLVDDENKVVAVRQGEIHGQA